MGKEKKSNLNGVVVNQRLRKACHVKGIPLVRTEALLRLLLRQQRCCPVPAPTWGAQIPRRSSSKRKHAAGARQVFLEEEDVSNTPLSPAHDLSGIQQG